MAAWGAVSTVPLNAAAGVFLRRITRGRFAQRMRPHYVLGYAALGLAAVHLLLSAGNMSSVNVNGIWLATFAFGGLMLQTFVGMSLQSPGAYRSALRRWHLFLFWSVAALILGHVALN
jgi:cytochrome b561